MANEADIFNTKASVLCSYTSQVPDWNIGWHFGIFLVHSLLNVISYTNHSMFTNKLSYVYVFKFDNSDTESTVK